MDNYEYDTVWTDIVVDGWRVTCTATGWTSWQSDKSMVLAQAWGHFRSRNMRLAPGTAVDEHSTAPPGYLLCAAPGVIQVPD